MIEVYLKGDICYEVDEHFSSMTRLIEDDFIKLETLLYAKLSDGYSVAFRKGDILSINECRKECI